MRLNRLDMNLTLCLDALLVERNVSRAATRLFVSQPAMSIALRRLRQHFNDELMVQSGRTYRLTSFAESLQKPVRDVVLQMQAISGWRPNFDPAKSDRTITIEASDYILTVYIIKALARVYAQAPGMRVAVRLLNSNYLEDLDSGEIDLLIIPDALSSENHPNDVLFTDTFSCVVWKDNALVKRSITRNQYLQLGHVITEWDGGRLDSLDETRAAVRGRHPADRHRADPTCERDGRALADSRPALSYRHAADRRNGSVAQVPRARSRHPMVHRLA
jgi:LysR family transcriptional regulator, nod-box dependent transcriptional activator